MQPQDSTPLCSTFGCSRPTHAKGLCTAHYEYLRRTGHIKGGCSAPGCAYPSRIQGLCEEHYCASPAQPKPKPRLVTPERASAEREATRERFWAHVDKESSPHGCWLWTGRIDNHGYGVVYNSAVKHDQLASRFSYEVAHGPIPPRMCACHNCPGGDNPLCVNPRDLFLGTRRENTQDAARKGQMAKGERNGGMCRRKVPPEAVPDIRRRFREGSATGRALAREYGVSASTISFICIGKRGAHIPD